VLLRLKEDYDGAEPAASSVSVINLLSLSHLTASEAMAQRIERTFGAFASRAAQMGRAVPMMLSALSMYHARIPQIVIVGEQGAEDTRALRRSVHAKYLPSAVIVPVVPAHREALARTLPWIATMVSRDGRATAYVCRDFTCQAPTTSASELASQLGR
jgi:uncharacterized protein YyaL (SSP411 family)